MDLEKTRFIHELIDDLPDVIGLVRVLRDEVIEGGP